MFEAKYVADDRADDARRWRDGKRSLNLSSTNAFVL